MKHLEIYIDGASKGNPGPAAVGAVICENGHVIKNISSYIGAATNNVAEYTALIYSLKEALVLKAESLQINTDSQLLHRQIKRIYKVKHPNILPLFQQAQHLLAGFKKTEINHIPREENLGADKLANKAIKEASEKNLF